mmetsp:Transcript_25100/g.47172  ORF Transcript_25100/g.47172 Transcript_25100/m.47172 type:complete len:318 (+) Transcript_25100:249-1202(+)
MRRRVMSTLQSSLAPVEEGYIIVHPPVGEERIVVDSPKNIHVNPMNEIMGENSLVASVMEGTGDAVGRSEAAQSPDEGLCPVMLSLPPADQQLSVVVEPVKVIRTGDVGLLQHCVEDWPGFLQCVVDLDVEKRYSDSRQRHRLGHVIVQPLVHLLLPRFGIIEFVSFVEGHDDQVINVTIVRADDGGKELCEQSKVPNVHLIRFQASASHPSCDGNNRLTDILSPVVFPSLEGTAFYNSGWARLPLRRHLIRSRLGGSGLEVVGDCYRIGDLIVLIIRIENWRRVFIGPVLSKVGIIMFTRRRRACLRRQGGRRRDI